ncbi:TrbG/VirB9 family P-type conjugative transfer protein [Candidatus Enterovibrio escicola]|uniref:TrbG/VirB9 family P-type conjugative transfer protein n=1 Tax=Candidatus Enterovibrio escicola TaxID=1927127 RepID=UPI001237F416
MKLIRLLLCIACVSVQAAITPKSQPFDSRITLTKYNPENVIRVRTKIGISTLIQFEQGEHISAPDSGMGIGDAQAWGIDVRGNNVFLKPIAEKPETNLIITTNKGRTYSFQLVTSKSPHYIIKLAYDKPKTGKDKKFDIPCFDGNANFRYGKWGDEALAPKYMWDDGRFTCLKFTKNDELPVAYQVASDSSESLINYHFEKDTMILHGISKEFRLRLGKQVLGLRSDAAISSGYNEKATSINGTRELNYD